jgi:hypothetical protein
MVKYSIIDVPPFKHEFFQFILPVSNDCLQIQQGSWQCLKVFSTIQSSAPLQKGEWSSVCWVSALHTQHTIPLPFLQGSHYRRHCKKVSEVRCVACAKHTVRFCPLCRAVTISGPGRDGMRAARPGKVLSDQVPFPIDSNTGIQGCQVDPAGLERGFFLPGHVDSVGNGPETGP